jgi:hypothetical protein
MSTSRAICCGATQSRQSDWHDKFILKTHTDFFLFSFSRARATTAAADFTDAAGLPPSPPALKLWSSTSPKVMDHF